MKPPATPAVIILVHVAVTLGPVLLDGSAFVQLGRVPANCILGNAFLDHIATIVRNVNVPLILLLSLFLRIAVLTDVPLLICPLSQEQYRPQDRFLAEGNDFLDAHLGQRAL